jgi:TonB family protein
LSLLVVLASCTAGAAQPTNISKIPNADASVAISAARPDYPYEARAQRITGTGIAVMEVDTSTGNVKRVYMAISTGSAILDKAATDGFGQWRFKPGTVSRVKTPITFTMADGRGGVEYVKSTRSMDDVLARFLGKGTVLHGPIPEYPRSVKWTERSGKGVYELHAGKDGRVQQVKILKSSRDAVFDAEAVKTLGKWRLRRGPLVLELPLSFTLLPAHYSVDVAR